MREKTEDAVPDKIKEMVHHHDSNVDAEVSLALHLSAHTPCMSRNFRKICLQLQSYFWYQFTTLHCLHTQMLQIPRLSKAVDFCLALPLVT